MTLTISLSVNLDAALKAHARAMGIWGAEFVETVLGQALDPSVPPFEERASASGNHLERQRS